jgi:hypothetical protein
MEDLTLQLAESEIRLGFAFVQAGLSCLKHRDIDRLVEAWQRAEGSYLRARKYIFELPESRKPPATAQLDTLRTSIDELAAQTPAQTGDSQRFRETEISHATCFFAPASAA